MSSQNRNGVNVIFVSDEENDTMEDLIFVKIEPDIDNIDIKKKTLQNRNTTIKSPGIVTDNLCSNKRTFNDNSNPLNLLKMTTDDSLSEQKNVSKENVQNSKSNLQKPFSIRVKSEFSEKKMIENCLSNKEITKVSENPCKEISTSKTNVQKKNLPIVLLRKIAIPRKKLQFLSKTIKTESKDLNNIPIKTEYDGLKKEPLDPELGYDNDKKSNCSSNKLLKEDDNCRSYECAYCGFTTSDKKSLKNHFLRHFENPNKCFHCDYRTSRPVHMKEHMKKHTGESYKCPQCPFKTIYQRSLKFHLLTHSKVAEYNCEICKASFFQPQNLKRHMRRHTKENRLECDYCKKEFYRKTHLINHINRHTGNKPYKCDICQLGFVQKYHLRRHQLTHFKEKKYACNLCPEKFDRLYSLKRHKTSHTGEKLYKCNICELQFIRPEHLKRHKADHLALSKKVNNKRTYKCKFCRFIALSAFVFNEHIDKHVNSNLIICNECGNSFEQKKKLIFHWRRNHRELL